MTIELFLILLVLFVLFIVFPLLFIQTFYCVINNDENIVSQDIKTNYLNLKLLTKKTNHQNNNPFGIMAYSSPALLPLAFISSKKETYVLNFEGGVSFSVNEKNYKKVMENQNYKIQERIETKNFEYKWYNKPLLIKWFLAIEPDNQEVYKRYILV